MMSLLRCSSLLQYCLVDFIAVGAVSSVLYAGDSAALAVSPMLHAFDWQLQVYGSVQRFTLLA